MVDPGVDPVRAQLPPRLLEAAALRLVAIATLDLERTTAFVHRVLRDLASDDDVTRRLVATLGVYLQEGQSRSRAARRLGIHENTVTYRVRQAEAVLGHSLDEGLLELGMALTLLSATR